MSGVGVTHIKFYDASGRQLGELLRARCRRFSMQAAADHRKMDYYWQHVSRAAATATVGNLVFKYRGGVSMFSHAE
jgi:hypothetical protein